MEKFHNTCFGKNVLIEESGTQATRVRDRFFGTVFGAVPLKPFQPVCVEITSEVDEWDGRLRYGFTNYAPEDIKLDPNNPYYMTELIGDGQVYMRRLPYEVSKVGHILSYYYTPGHTVFVSFDGTPSVEISSASWRGKVDLSRPVWPILDLYAGTKAVKIVQAPPEVLAHGAEAIAAYKVAATAGTIPIYQTRLMLVGQERVGKTSLKKNLVNEEFCVDEASTEGIDVSLYNVAHPAHPAQSNLERWKSQEGHEVEEIESSYFHGVAESMTCIPVKQNQPERESSTHFDDKHPKEVTPEPLETEPPMSQEESESPTTPTLLSRIVATGSARPKLLLPENFKSSVYTEDELEKGQLDDINEIPAQVVELFTKHVPRHSFESVEVRIWDFAGQDLYYTTHQVFLSRKAVYLVVFDISKDLTQQADVTMISVDSTAQEDSRFGRQYSVCGHHHGFTCLDFLDFWMRSIYSFIEPNSETDDVEQLSPPIFIVGTHKNALHDDPEIREQMVKEKMNTIKSFVEGQCYRKHVVTKYYAVENNLAQQDPVTQLKMHIERTIQKEPYMKERIPLRWLLFQKKIQETTKKEKVCISLKEAEEIYNSDSLQGTLQQPSPSEILTMLEYYHDIGQIIYIKNGGEDLRNLVILDPNWLIEIFKEIICVIDVDDENKRAIDVDSWQKLRQQGILDDQLMTYLLRPFLKNVAHDEVRSRKNALIELMKKFDLLCEKETPKGHSCKSYFVPSRLQPLHLDPVEPSVTPSSTSQPSCIFYVDFHGFLPDGFFHRIVLRTVKWSQEQCDDVEPVLEYGRVKFYADHCHECVLEMAPAKDARIKVIIEAAPIVGMSPTCFSEAKRKKQLRKAVIKVHGFLEASLGDLKRVWAKRIQYTLSFSCPCNKGGCHLLDISKCKRQDIVVCAMRKHIDTTEIKRQFCTDLDSEPNEGNTGAGIDSHAESIQKVTTLMADVHVSPHTKNLLDISKNLKSIDTQRLVFLCRDLIAHHDLGNIKTGMELFQALEQEKHIKRDGDTSLLLEILCAVRRIDLSDKLADKMNVPRFTKDERVISRFRYLLLQIAMTLSDSEIEEVTIMAADDILGCAKDNIQDIYHLLVLLEENGHISEGDVRCLHQDLITDHHMLKRKIKDYEDAIKEIETRKS